MNNLCVYYINLERAKLRKISMENQLSEKKILFKRVSAVNAENMEKNKIIDTTDNDKEYKFYKKEGLEYKISDRNVAITLSHFKVFQDFLANDKNDYCIIMEDDVSLQYIEDFYKEIEIVLKHAPNNWDIISLHSSLDRVIKDCIELYKNNIYFKVLKKNEMKSSACYLITKQAAKELLNRYLVNGVYTFPYQLELCSSESIIHQLNSYLYTKPTISIIDNNITSMGSYHVFDRKSNEVIRSFYKENIYEINMI